MSLWAGVSMGALHELGRVDGMGQGGRYVILEDGLSEHGGVVIMSTGMDGC